MSGYKQGYEDGFVVGIRTGHEDMREKLDQIINDLSDVHSGLDCNMEIHGYNLSTLQTYLVELDDIVHALEDV